MDPACQHFCLLERWAFTTHTHTHTHTYPPPCSLTHRVQAHSWDLHACLAPVKRGRFISAPRSAGKPITGPLNKSPDRTKSLSRGITPPLIPWQGPGKAEGVSGTAGNASRDWTALCSNLAVTPRGANVCVCV